MTMEMKCRRSVSQMSEKFSCASYCCTVLNKPKTAHAVHLRRCAVVHTTRVHVSCGADSGLRCRLSSGCRVQGWHTHGPTGHGTRTGHGRGVTPHAGDGVRSARDKRPTNNTILNRAATLNTRRHARRDDTRAHFCSPTQSKAVVYMLLS